MQSGGDWVVTVCYNPHWECPNFMRDFKATMMFPLSEELPEGVNLGWVDSHGWLGFEEDFNIVL